MKTELVTDTGDQLLAAIRRFEADSSIQGLMIFATAESAPQPAELDPALQDLSVPVFGGVFPQVLSAGEKHETGAVVAGLRTEPDVTIVPDLSNPDAQFGQSIPDTVPAGGTAFVLVDAYATRVEDFVERLFTSYGVDLTYLGGGAGSLDMEHCPCLFTNEGLLEDVGVFATVDAATSIGVKHGWEEIAGPLQVTKASGPTLSELKGEPAADVYRRIVEADAGVTLDADNFFEVAKMYPFGISRLDGEKIVRDPFEINDDGSLTCFGNVPEGDYVHVLRGDPESLIDAAGEAYDEAVAGTDGSRDVFFFDCISRVLYLEDAFEEELEAVGGAHSPTIGALTIGEIANDGRGHLEFYNKTAVTAVTDQD